MNENKKVEEKKVDESNQVLFESDKDKNVELSDSELNEAITEILNDTDVDKKICCTICYSCYPSKLHTYECNHLICLDCIKKLVQYNSSPLSLLTSSRHDRISCPTCKKVYSRDDHKPIPIFFLDMIKTMIMSLNTSCPFCKIKGTLRAVYRHFHHCLECPMECLQCKKKYPKSEFNAEHLLIRCERCDIFINKCGLVKHEESCEKKIITCKNKPCNWEGFRKFWINHNNTSCEFIECKCECGFKDIRKNYEKHLKDDCKFRKIKCDRCNENIKLNEKEHHEKFLCKKIEVECEDCKTKITRENLTEHINKQCPYKRINCPLSICNYNNLRYNMQEHSEGTDNALAHLTKTENYLNDHHISGELITLYLNVLTDLAKSDKNSLVVDYLNQLIKLPMIEKRCQSELHNNNQQTRREIHESPPSLISGNNSYVSLPTNLPSFLKGDYPSDYPFGNIFSILSHLGISEPVIPHVYESKSIESKSKNLNFEFVCNQQKKKYKFIVEDNKIDAEINILQENEVKIIRRNLTNTFIKTSFYNKNEVNSDQLLQLLYLDVYYIDVNSISTENDGWLPCQIINTMNRNLPMIKVESLLPYFHIIFDVNICSPRISEYASQHTNYIKRH